MMNATIFDKTDKGREEIATRAHQLSPRLRPLLVMINGKQQTSELLEKVAALGLNEDSMAELLNLGFIHVVSEPASPEPASATPAATVADPPPAAPSVTLPEGQTQFEAIYRFYTGTIKSQIGLRGYGLQLKVEKAASVEDFRSLRQAYLQAIFKAKGRDTALQMREELDKLLYLGEPHLNYEPVLALGEAYPDFATVMAPEDPKSS